MVSTGTTGCDYGGLLVVVFFLTSTNAVLGLLAFVVVGYCNVSGRYCFVTWTEPTSKRPFLVLCLKKLFVLLDECQPHLLNPIPDDISEEDFLHILDVLFFHGFHDSMPSCNVRKYFGDLVPPIDQAICLLDLAVDFDHTETVSEFERLAVVLPSSWVFVGVESLVRVEGRNSNPPPQMSLRKFGHLTLAEVKWDGMAYPDLTKLNTILLDSTVTLNRQTGNMEDPEQDEYMDTVTRRRQGRRSYKLVQMQLHRVPVSDEFLGRHYKSTYSIVKRTFLLLRCLLHEDVIFPRRPDRFGMCYLSNGQILGLPKTSRSWLCDSYSESDLKSWYESPKELHRWIKTLTMFSDEKEQNK